MIYLCLIIPILQRLKNQPVLHPVYFFNKRSSASDALHLLVQHGFEFCSFSVYDSNNKEVNAWAMYESKTPLTESLVKDITAKQEWLVQSFQSVTIVDYTPQNTWIPESFAKEGTETALLDLITGSRAQTVTLKDSTDNAVNFYHVDAARNSGNEASCCRRSCYYS